MSVFSVKLGAYVQYLIGNALLHKRGEPVTHWEYEPRINDITDRGEYQAGGFHNVLIEPKKAVPLAADLAFSKKADFVGTMKNTVRDYPDGKAWHPTITFSFKFDQKPAYDIIGELLVYVSWTHGQEVYDVPALKGTTAPWPPEYQNQIEFAINPIKNFKILGKTVILSWISGFPTFSVQAAQRISAAAIDQIPEFEIVLRFTSFGTEQITPADQITTLMTTRGSLGVHLTAAWLGPKPKMTEPGEHE